MPSILGANTLSSGYDVDNSCIFDRASTDNMTKSMSDGSSIKGTFSAWIKVDGTGNEMNILSHFEDTNNVFTISTSGSGVNVVDYNSGYSLQLSTNRLMRDPSAWFHLYIAIDRSQGTADNRNRMFINGVEETSFSHRTNYSQQTSGSHQDAISMNDGDCTMYLGGLGDGNQMFGGYLAELHWIDGTVPAVTEFGEFDEDSGIWKPKLVSGISYGTNGFYLDFQDASNLGNDANGGTDLTENNIASTNQSTDTCTNNYATLNPLHFNATIPSANTLSEGNLVFTSSQGGSAYPGFYSTIAVSQGKWYAEFKATTADGSTLGIGEGIAAGGFLGGSTNDGVIFHNGNFYTNGSGASTGYDAWSDDDILGVALDLDNNKVYFHKNNTYMASGNPAGNSGGEAITAAASTNSGVYHFCAGDASSGTPAIQCNFGSPPFAISSGNTDGNGYGNFEYAVPSGFYALNTKKPSGVWIMAYTTIDKPSDYFETVTYAGGTTDISSLDFQPDWVWGKKRDGTESHGLFDSVRGATKDLRSDSNAVESTRSGSLTSFDNDGFTMGGSDGIISNSGSTYVAWCWRAGTSFTNDASSTSVGSIDSAGSVNTDAGFSIIGYTGDAQTGTTIAHGLGVKPNMIILKNREPDISNWQVYHSSLGATHYVQLNSTGAATDSNTRWNDVEPTSTVFTTGSSGDVKGDNSGETFIAYCFAEKQGYSKFGTYTGNGNADGTFFYTGFKPKFVIFKRSSGTGNWQLLDNKRLGYNVENHTIYPNSNIAEQDETDGDILSNGFKLRNTGTDGNGSGSTYIYMAFANNPFVTSTGIPTTAE